MLSRCFLDFSVGEGAFVIGLSHTSSISIMARLNLLCNIVPLASTCLALFRWQIINDKGFLIPERCV